MLVLSILKVESMYSKMCKYPLPSHSKILTVREIFVKHSSILCSTVLQSWEYCKQWSILNTAGFCIANPGFIMFFFFSYTKEGIILLCVKRSPTEILKQSWLLSCNISAIFKLSVLYEKSLAKCSLLQRMRGRKFF